MKIRLKHVLALLSATTLGSCLAQRTVTFSEEANRLLERPQYSHARLGYEIVSLDTGKVLASRNENQFFGPASTIKLLTVATALAELGQDYRFHTDVYRSGPIVNGVLHGDLILVASGDPNLSSQMRSDGTLIFGDRDHSYGGPPVAGDPLHSLRLLASQVREEGIRRIDGQVRIDASLFPEGEREQGTDTVISPISLNDNLVDITVSGHKEKGAAEFEVSPATSYVTIKNKSSTIPAGGVSTLKLAEDSTSSLMHLVLNLEGEIPDGSKVHLLYRVPSPITFAAVAFSDVLSQSGVQNTTSVRRSSSSTPTPDYGGSRRVAEYVSPPLREQVRVILKLSQNLQACILLKDLGVLHGPARDSSDSDAFSAQRNFLSDAGLDLEAVTAKTGADSEAITPDFMTKFLVYLRHTEIYPFVDAALPILGVDGSLADIQRENSAAGNVRAKTGTDMSRNPLGQNTLVTAKGLAGYITTRSSHHVAFALYSSGALGNSRTIGEQMSNDLAELAATAYQEF